MSSKGIEQLSDVELAIELAFAAEVGDDKLLAQLRQVEVSRVDNFSVSDDQLDLADQYYEFDHDKEVNELDVKVREANFSLVRYLSMYDVKRSGIEWRDLTQKEKDDSLYSVGLDVSNYRYITHLDTHVTMEGYRKTCVRFLAQERTDDEWIASGYASQEAELTHRGDPSFSREIQAMQRGIPEFPQREQEDNY